MNLTVGLVALVGLYAVVSYQVSRKTREIGIRMALGAERPNVVKSVLVHAAPMVALGLTLGILLSIAGNSALRSLNLEAEDQFEEIKLRGKIL